MKSDSVAEYLFSYLRDVIYNPEKAVLDIAKLPEEFQDFGKGLKYFAECVMEGNDLARALSKGDLTGKLPPRDNELAAPLKSLHSSLKHLTWQSQQIARGDYMHRIEFLGDFSAAFNMMVEQLAERQQKLEDKLEQIQKQKAALEQGNLMLAALMHYVPQQIIVTDQITRKILLTNDIVMTEVRNDPCYIENILKLISERGPLGSSSEIDITYKQGDTDRYFLVKNYSFEWSDSSARVFAITDVTAAKYKIKALEMHAYHDNITKLYNRTFGMQTLDSWLQQKKRFALVFTDLDGLKFMNDEYGHHEGDMYILNAAKHLRLFSSAAIVCRIGGDEFMLLVPDIDYDEAHSVMLKIYDDLQKDEYLKGKPYKYSISFGISAVEPDNTMAASDILGIADERMYINKRMRKKERRSEREALSPPRPYQI
ncbi:MAG: diguanylate cyclase [Treponema sp.]|nr:diguanylate cyclase [Treponema sp.]MCL2232818.1 diguanylate cyclase [Treponema sp.]